MNINFKFFADWRFIIPSVIALISLFWSIFNFIVGKITLGKLTSNDLKHLAKDVEDLKEENKEYKLDLKKELGKIYRRLGHIEKNQGIRKAICDERHKNDN